MERSVKVRLELAIAGYQAAAARATASTKAIGTEVAQTSRKSRQEMQTVGTAAAVMGGAIAGALALSGGAAISFESSFAGVRKTVNASEPEFARLAAGMRDMARSIPTNVNELNAIGEAAGQLGIAKEHLLGFARTMADLGETTNLSSDQAATSLARLANITQLPQTEFDRLGSTIVALGNNFATTESEIVEMGMRLAGAGNQIGMTEAQILGMATALTSVGINAEAGGSALSKVMVEIASQVENGGDKLATFARISGMTVEEFATQWEQDASGALVSFVTGLGDIEAQGGSTLQTLEDLEITEVRMRDALLRSAGAGDLLTRAMDEGTEAFKANTALAKEAAQRYETVEARVKIARNAINDAGITIGQTFTPAIGSAADATAGLAGFIADLPAPAAAGVTAVGGLAGAASLAGGAFLLAAPRIIETKDALSVLATSMPTTVKALRAIPSLLMGPWGAALAIGATALTVFAMEQGKARRRVEELTETLDDQTGAITENTRAHVALRLEEEGAIDRGRKLGLTTKDVVDAALGQADAVARVNRVIGEARGAYQDAQGTQDKYNKALTDAAGDASVLEVQLGTLRGELEASTEATRKDLIVQAEAEGTYLDVAHAMEAGNSALEAGFIIQGQTRDAAGNTASALGPLADGYSEVGEEAETATEKIDRFNDRVEGQFNPVLAVANALQDVADAEAALADARAGTVGDGGTFASEAEKAEAVAEALDKQLRAAVDTDGAMRRLEAGIKDGTITTAGAIQMMEGWISQGWLSREAADAFLEKVADVHGELDDLTSQIWNLQLVADTSGAEEDIRRLASMLTQVTGTKYVHVEGSRSTVVPRGVNRDDFSNHDGGWAGTGPIHTGPLKGDEFRTVLQTGEFTLNRADAAALDGYGLLPRQGQSAADLVRRMREGNAVASSIPVAAAAAPTAGGGPSRVFQVAEGAVQVVAPDSRRAGSEAAWQLDRIAREMGG